MIRHRTFTLGMLVLLGRVALVALAVLVAPTTASARVVGLELASTTRWQTTRSAERLGLDGAAGFTLVGSVGVAPSLRAELLWRVMEESGAALMATNAETLEHQIGIGVGKRLVERNWWSVEACGALGASWRRLQLWDWQAGSRAADWRGWSPFVEAGAALEAGLPRSMTHDRYALGLRLQLGWHHVVGRDVALTVRGAAPADVERVPVALGTWTISGPMTRFGVFARF